MAILVLAVFAFTMAAYAGVQVHAYFEAQNSITHWREAAKELPANQGVSMESPTSRINRLEHELDWIAERFFLSVGMFLFFGTLAILGRKKLF